MILVHRLGNNTKLIKLWTHVIISYTIFSRSNPDEPRKLSFDLSILV